MDTELKSYLNTLDEILTEAERKTKSSSIEMLNWQPHARDVNSIAAILTHMHGVASFWIFQALTGEDVNRNRAIEFQAIISDRNEVPTLLHQARIRIQKAIGNCTHSDLDATIHLTNNKDCTKRDAIIPSIKELAHHLGHIDMTIQMYNWRDLRT